MSSVTCTDPHLMCIFCGKTFNMSHSGSSLEGHRESIKKNQVFNAIECAIELVEKENQIFENIEAEIVESGVKFEGISKAYYQLNHCNSLLESKSKRLNIEFYRLKLINIKSAKLKLYKMKHQYSEFLCERNSTINANTIFVSCNKHNCCRFHEKFTKSSCVSGCYSPESDLEL